MTKDAGSGPTVTGWWPLARPGDLVAYLDEGEYRRLLAAMEQAEVEEDALLLHKGSPSRSLLLVEDGEVEIVEETLEEVVVLDRIGPGGVVGEVGFLDGRPRTHDVRAACVTRVRRLTRDRLLALAEGDPTLFAKLTIGLAEIMARRFRAAVEQLHPMRAFAASLGARFDQDEEQGRAEEQPFAWDELDDPDPDHALHLLRELARQPGKDVSGV
jgi:CRP-like cAMP-binding protein